MSVPYLVVRYKEQRETCRTEEYPAKDTYGNRKKPKKCLSQKCRENMPVLQNKIVGMVMAVDD